MSKIRLVLSSCPDLDSAERLAKLALEEHLVACVNMIPIASSMYSWKGEFIKEREYLLLAKSTEERLANLESLWKTHHPYEVPEFLVIDAATSSKEYGKWVEKCCLG